VTGIVQDVQGLVWMVFAFGQFGQQRPELDLLGVLGAGRQQQLPGLRNVLLALARQHLGAKNRYFHGVRPSARSGLQNLLDLGPMPPGRCHP